MHRIVMFIIFFDNKNKHLVAIPSYGHSDSVACGKESHSVFLRPTKTRDRLANDAFISKIINDSITLFV